MTPWNVRALNDASELITSISNPKSPSKTPSATPPTSISTNQRRKRIPPRRAEIPKIHSNPVASPSPTRSKRLKSLISTIAPPRG